jgi:hypothetical protein
MWSKRDSVVARFVVLNLWMGQLQQPAKGKKSDQVRANGPKMYELKEDMRFTHDGSSLTELENRNKLRQV